MQSRRMLFKQHTLGGQLNGILLQWFHGIELMLSLEFNAERSKLCVSFSISAKISSAWPSSIDIHIDNRSASVVLLFFIERNFSQVCQLQTLTLLIRDRVKGGPCW